MGITSLLVAEADAERVPQGKPRAVKAIWADVPMSDAYRDVTFHGGAVDAGFTWADRLANAFQFAGQKVVTTALGDDAAYDGAFNRLRSPGDRADQIRVPVVLTGDRWQHYDTWPAPRVAYTPYYLGAEKTLAADEPAAAGGDRAPLLPASSPCSRLTTQWTAGAAAGPCETDNRTYEATALTYTTPPLERETQLTGPVVANLWPVSRARIRVPESGEART